jgi:hypothetical protein
VFRARHLDGCRFEPGARFHFDLHLFDPESPAIAYLVLAFSELAQEGLGPRRGCVELAGVSQLDERRQPAVELYDRSMILQEPAAPLEIDLAPQPTPVTRVRVRFVTPTELKSGHEIAGRPEFTTLAARIRDRISTLRALYGEGPLDIDFRGFGDRAAGIRLTDCRLRQVEIVRRSSRTGQRHPIGGFSGEAEYEGDLTEFVPYLRAAQWTGVGRQTVWGKGEIATECLG